MEYIHDKLMVGKNGTGIEWNTKLKILFRLIESKIIDFFSKNFFRDRSDK